MDSIVLGILQARILEWGNLSLLQGIFPNQGSNPGLPHCRQILSQLSHKGSPRILEWVAYPFSSRSSGLRNRTGVSCIAGRLFIYQLSYQGSPYMQNLMQINLFTHQKYIHRCIKWIYNYQGGKGQGGDRSGVWDWHVHTAIFKIDKQQGPTVYSPRNSAKYSVIT